MHRFDGQGVGWVYFDGQGYSGYALQAAWWNTCFPWMGQVADGRWLLLLTDGIGPQILYFGKACQNINHLKDCSLDLCHKKAHESSLCTLPVTILLDNNACLC